MSLVASLSFHLLIDLTHRSLSVCHYCYFPEYEDPRC